MINRAIFIFSIIGLVISAFLVYEYLQVTPVICPITGNGCDIVKKSEFSSLFGISIPYYGVLFYTVVALISVFLTQNNQKIVNQFRLLISLAAVAFGIYLTYIEAFVIHAYCFWCVSSFIVSIVIVILAFASLNTKVMEKSK